mmetsp:Transcript_100765/g.194788  ORF Transcript_100765/g.194788 Transcript_100765/m.194788 type:complete len:248 (-) Transcript_100765:103-846(-)
MSDPLFRILAEAIWLSLAIGLLAWQGALRDPAQLRDRLTYRLQHIRLDPQEQQWALGIAIIGSVLLAAGGLLSGFCHLGLPHSWSGAGKQLVINFFMPGLLEELIFRGLLIRLSAGNHLPSTTIVDEHGQALCRPDGHGSTIASSCQHFLPSRPPAWELTLTLVIFVLYHLDLMHGASVFRDPRFLVMAAVLGLCCQEAVLRTRSLWPGVLMHWLWVWAWLNFGGGLHLFVPDSGTGEARERLMGDQ